MNAASSPPSIAVVTPSFNQGAFLAATIESILSQNYPSLEYVLMDGGSSDESIEIIRCYADRLHHWFSVPDCGQYDAINKGFARTSGEIMGWLNSDDLHTPWTLSVVGEIFETFPEVEWLTTAFPLRWDALGRAVSCTHRQGFSRSAILAGDTFTGKEGCVIGPIQQESTFWRRSLWEKAGGALDISLDAAADFDLWMRFAHHAELIAVTTPLAGFRRHGEQKTSLALDKYQQQAHSSFLKNGGCNFNSALYQKVRNFCRHRLPAVLMPLAASVGLAHRATICQRSRDNTSWQLKQIWI